MVKFQTATLSANFGISWGGVLVGYDQIFMKLSGLVFVRLSGLFHNAQTGHGGGLCPQKCFSYRWWLGAEQVTSIILTTDDPFQWRIYTVQREGEIALHVLPRAMGISHSETFVVSFAYDQGSGRNYEFFMASTFGKEERPPRG